MSPKKINDLSLKKKQSLNKTLSKNVVGNGNKEDVNKFRVSDLLNRKWKVFRVSPMYNFSRDKLKFYETKLNEDMNSEKRTSSNINYRSKFTLTKNLGLSDCAEAIQVIVKVDLQNTYVGNFISWSNRKPNSKGSVSLPILLVEGKPHEIYSVHSSLCKIFDCDIQPVTFSFDAMIAFLVKVLESPRSNIDFSEEQIVMEYKVPECEVNDKIKISLFLESTIIVFAKVMDNLHEKYQGITNMEIIWEFYNKILQHVYHIFKVDLTLAELQKIAFPDALLTSDGQLKMSSLGVVISTLNVLEYFTPLDAIINI